MSVVRTMKSRGSGNGQFEEPAQLATDHISRVFISDCGNTRVCTLDTNLNHLYNIMLGRPVYDVKVSCNLVYVLFAYGNPCVCILTLEGEKLRSFITGSLGSYLFLFGSTQQFCY